MSSWLEARGADVITASEAASIYGIGFESPFQLWARKTGQVQRDDLSKNERVYWGNVHEPTVIRECQLRTGRRALAPSEWSRVVRCEVLTLEHEGQPKYVLRNPALPLFTCTPDFILDRWTRLPGLDDQVEHEGPGCGEAKTADKHQAREWDKAVPLKYQVQVQMQMLVSGLSWACVPVLIGGNDFRIYDVQRNDAFCADMVQRLSDWHREHVVLGVPPPVGEDDESTIKLLYSKGGGGAIVLPAEPWATLDRRRERAKAAKSKLEKLIKTYDAQIKAALANADVASIEGTSVQYQLSLVNRAGYTVDPTTYRQLDRVEFRAKGKPRAAKAPAASATDDTAF